MATVREYVETLMADFGMQTSSARLDIEISVVGGNPAALMTSDSVVVAKKTLVAIIPGLLLKPDVTESGMSLKWDRRAIITYYSALCAELGLDDLLNPQPKIQSKSEYW